MLDSKQFDTVVQSNFMRSYKVRTEKEKEYLALPSSVREFAGQLTGEMRMDKLLE